MIFFTYPYRPILYYRFRNGKPKSCSSAISQHKDILPHDKRTAVKLSFSEKVFLLMGYSKNI